MERNENQVEKKCNTIFSGDFSNTEIETGNLNDMKFAVI